MTVVDTKGHPDTTDTETKVKFSIKPQIIASLIASIGAFGLGTAIGWSSPALPSLKATCDLGELSPSQESWIGSLPALGCTFSGPVAGFAMTRLGRKDTIILLQLPLLVGWALISTASTVPVLLAGRFLTGFAGGAMSLVVPVYTTEIAEDRIRGALGSFMQLALSSGISFSYCVGAFVSWKWLSIINASIPILGLTMVLMPESPLSLLQHGKHESAQKALVWLRGANSTTQIDNELKKMEASLAESTTNQSSCTINDFFVGSVLKPLGIIFGLFFFQLWSGIDAILCYAVDIFKSAGTNIDSNICAIIISIVVTVINIPTVIWIDRFGRKPILIIAEVGITISLAALGIFFHLKSQNGGEIPEGLGWLPLTSLILFIGFFGFGLASVPWLLLGELLPSNVKGFAGGLANSYVWGFAFVVSLAFGKLCEILTTQGCYWLFAGISAIGVAFCIFIVPETKGKSFDEISAMFK